METNFDLSTRVIMPIEQPPFPVRSALYFLEGEYLLRYPNPNGPGAVSKFITAADVSAAFTHTEQDSGYVPAGVVRWGRCVRGRFFVYSTPPQKVTIQVKTESLTVPIPRLVLLAIENTHYLWALKGQHFNKNDVAYHAPFPNIYSDGKVCWGTNVPPVSEAEQARRAWDTFIQSGFNNDLANGKSREYHQDILVMLRDLHQRKVSKYPVADLVPADNNRIIGAMIDTQLEGK